MEGPKDPPESRTPPPEVAMSKSPPAQSPEKDGNNRGLKRGVKALEVGAGGVQGLRYALHHSGFVVVELGRLGIQGPMPPEQQLFDGDSRTNSAEQTALFVGIEGHKIPSNLAELRIKAADL